MRAPAQTPLHPRQTSRPRSGGDEQQIPGRPSSEHPRGLTAPAGLHSKGATDRGRTAAIKEKQQRCEANRTARAHPVWMRAMSPDGNVQKVIRTLNQVFGLVPGSLGPVMSLASCRKGGAATPAPATRVATPLAPTQVSIRPRDQPARPMETVVPSRPSTPYHQSIKEVIGSAAQQKAPEEPQKAVQEVSI